MKKWVIIILLVIGSFGLYKYVIAPHLPTAECPACQGSGQMITKEPVLRGVKIAAGPSATVDENGQMQVNKEPETDLGAPRERKVPCKWCANGTTTPAKAEEIEKALEKEKANK